MADTTNTDTTAASGAASEAEIERAAFDAWAMEHGYQSDELARSTLSLVGFQYFNTNVESAFQAWRAGRASALAAPAAQEAEPVATVQSYSSGSYWRNYKLEWHRDVPEGTKLYARPPRPQADAGAVAAACGDDDHVLVPRHLIGSACAAMARKLDAPKTIAELRRYTTGDLSAAAPQAPAAPAKPNCARCQGSGEDPEGFYDQSKGDAGQTHDGPCRVCGGSGEPPGARPLESAALVSARHLLAADPAAHAGTVIKMIDVMLGQAPVAPTAAAAEQAPAPAAGALEKAWRAGWAACRDAEYVGEAAEDEAWGASEINGLAIDIEQSAPAAGAAPTDTEVLALNAGEVYFSESRLAGHGTQYHAGAPGVLSFARAVMARWGAAAPAQEAEDGWMPIETAPRDGRVLLLGYYNAQGRWRTLRGEWVDADQIAEYWEVEAEPGWYETSVEAEDPPNAWPTNPTHWRLPPAPPAARARQEGSAA